MSDNAGKLVDMRTACENFKKRRDSDSSRKEAEDKKSPPCSTA